MFSVNRVDGDGLIGLSLVWIGISKKCCQIPNVIHNESQKLQSDAIKDVHYHDGKLVNGVRLVPE